MMDNEPASVGFIGLGTMGFPMASNLITKLATGSKLFVYDVSADAVGKFQAKHQESVVPCNSAKDVAERCVSPGPCSHAAPGHGTNI